MCTGLLPPGANPIAVKILIIIINDIHWAILTAGHTAEAKNAWIKFFVKHDGIPYQKFGKILMFRQQLREKAGTELTARRSRSGCEGAGCCDVRKGRWKDSWFGVSVLWRARTVVLT